MKKNILTILIIAFVITTIGFIADGDVKEPNVLMRFFEFFMMTGIVFTLISIVYFSFVFAKKNILKA
jgi:cytochrome bd-type quinol oxidase subunit 1